MKQVLAIYRAERFSPNSVAKDKAIMDAVGAALMQRGHSIRAISEEQLTDGDTADIILTMGRLRTTAEILERKKAQGIRIINSPEGIRSCARACIDRIMRAAGIPVAPLSGCEGYWLKRGDEAAQSKDDVVFAADEAQKDAALASFARRGISSVVVTAHVSGDLIKFYGVRGTGFFRTYYPCDDGEFKFGDERLNGSSHHYGFSSGAMWRDAEHTAGLAGIDVYGGDCIVREDGSYAIIDFNDWPSFSRCREDAAEAIAGMVCRMM